MIGSAAPFTVRYLGGPTAVLEVGGVRLVTDPTFDPPGAYPIGKRELVKTMGPAYGPEKAGAADAVLLSHHQHPDNLDKLGAAYVAEAPLTLSTPSAADRLGGAVRALPAWEAYDLPRPDGGTLQVTGVPALHGPPGSEPLVGEVTGFVLSGAGLPTVYVSGDNASLDHVRTIAARLGPFDAALLFAGAAQTPLAGSAYLTLTSDEAAEAARVLAPAHVIPLHFEGWAHFTQGRDDLRAAFARAGLLDRVTLLEPGESATV
ncbi:MAG TPA: MBL fold metallo-hydrolase [Streptosporangiaceae bacterium]